MKTAKLIKYLGNVFRLKNKLNIKKITLNNER